MGKSTVASCSSAIPCLPKSSYISAFRAIVQQSYSTDLRNTNPYSNRNAILSVSITYGKKCFLYTVYIYIFYKLTRRKLKHGNSLLYRSINSPYIYILFVMAYAMVYNGVNLSVFSIQLIIETWLFTNQSSRFQNVIL